MKMANIQRIRGIYPPAVPPEGAEATGQKTPSGDVIYRRTVNPRVKQPKMENGKQVTRGGNPMTGEPGTPVFEWVKQGKRDEFFYISRGKHGNNRIIVIDPDALEAEKERKETRTRKEQLLERVAQLASDTKMDLDEAAKRILGIATPPADPVPADPAPEPAGPTITDEVGVSGEVDPDYEAARDAAESEAT